MRIEKPIDVPESPKSPTEPDGALPESTPDTLVLGGMLYTLSRPELAYTERQLPRLVRTYERAERHPNSKTTATRLAIARTLFQTETEEPLVIGGYEVSGSAKAIIQTCVGAELCAADQILQQDASIKKGGADLIEAMTINMSEAGQRLFREGLDNVSENQPLMREAAIRRWNGESRRSRVKSLGQSEGRLDEWGKKFKKTIGPANMHILELLTPQFPAIKTYSVMHDLDLYLELIDTEAAYLGRRLGPKYLAYIGHTLFAEGVEAERTAALLMRLNRETHVVADSAKGSLGPNSHLYSKAGLRYEENNKALIASFGAIPTKLFNFERPKRNVYENSDEAMELIIEAMAEGAVHLEHHEGAREHLLTKEQEAHLAKSIEVGLFAEQLLQARGTAKQPAQPDSLVAAGCSDKDLERYAHIPTAKLRGFVKEGKASYRRFVKGNVLLAEKVAIGDKERMESPLDDSQLIIAGMQGIIRAVRKFDYDHEGKQYKFSTYAYSWAADFVRREIYRSDWGVPLYIGTEIMRISGWQGRLHKELQREPTHKEIAAAANVSDEHLREMLQHRRYILEDKSLPDYEVSAERYAPAKHEAQFSVDTRDVLEQTFADRPSLVKILEAHFALGYTFAEIAQELDAEVKQVKQDISEALATLRDSFSAEEIINILS